MPRATPNERCSPTGETLRNCPINVKTHREPAFCKNAKHIKIGAKAEKERKEQNTSVVVGDISRINVVKRTGMRINSTCFYFAAKVRCGRKKIRSLGIHLKMTRPGSTGQCLSKEEAKEKIINAIKCLLKTGGLGRKSGPKKKRKGGFP